MCQDCPFIAQLHLKEGCPIILLQNIDTKRGLCNGMRATIVHMSNCLLNIQLLTGDHTGESTLISRITLSPLLTGLNFAIKLNRRQFPIQLTFAMTINKAQGQSIKHIGIDLCKPVFAHGQLYVALSHAMSSQHIKVLLPNDLNTKKTRNVVNLLLYIIGSFTVATYFLLIFYLIGFYCEFHSINLLGKK
jgi:hypothetical protein